MSLTTFTNKLIKKKTNGKGDKKEERGKGGQCKKENDSQRSTMYIHWDRSREEAVKKQRKKRKRVKRRKEKAIGGK